MKKMDSPLVSVVIPTYNRVHTLPMSIDSVLNQTYGNLEVIIMDDGSEDGTEEYVKNMTDPRIRYRKSSTNLGASAARNLGAELARGEYIAFQDSDDEWLPDKLEKQMELMQKDESLSMVYCEFGLYREGELLTHIPLRDMPYEQKYGDLFSQLLLFPLISTQTILVRKDAFLSEKGFNETLKAYEDFEFTLRFSRKHRIGFVEESLVKVYSSQGSVSKCFGERVRSQFFMVREMLESLRGQGILWNKIEIILREAESHLCHDIFIEELTCLSEELLNEEECRSAQEYLDGIRCSVKKGILDTLPGLKAGILRIYEETYIKKEPWSIRQRQELTRLTEIVLDSEKVFPVPMEMKEQHERIRQRQEDSSLQWTDQLLLLADMVELLENLEKQIPNSL